MVVVDQVACSSACYRAQLLLVCCDSEVSGADMGASVSVRYHDVI